MGEGETIIGNTRFVWGSRTYVMGIVNITPDSFSGDGVGSDVETAVSQALQFEAWGADIVDVGGESTRPPGFYSGAEPVSADEESTRVIPVISALVSALRVPISVDTSKADVARQAVAAGASMINDVWGLRRDPEMAAVAVETGVPVVLMHNQDGTEYDDLVPDVIGGLRGLMESALDAGIPEEKIVLDPGIGFGKTTEQSLEVLRRLHEFASLGRPILTGTSRKSSIGKVLDLPVDERIEGTASTVALSIAGGADIVRVHDVREMVRVARMSDAIVRGWSEQ
ncbi:MAG: dihydropteroate synthase [SAR202 cluster bacterium]|nr:dihydropteroate synthase [SAR202 cluster bacterium]